MDNREQRRQPERELTREDSQLRVLLQALSLRASASDASGLAHTLEQSAVFDVAHQAAELFRAVVDISPDPIMITDLSGTVLMCNHEAAIRLGASTPDELIGLSGFDLVVPDDRQRAAENARRTLEEGEVRNVEYQLLRRDGTKVAVELNATLIRDPHGQPRAFVAVVRNVSESKRVAAALRTSEEKLRMSLSQMPYMVWTTDSELRVTSLSGVAFGRFDVDLADQPGKQLGELFGGDEIGKPAIEAHCRALKGEEEGYHHTFGDRHFECRVRPFRDDNGQILGCVGIALDVTERRKAEEALRRSEEKLLLGISQMPSIIWTTDRELRVTSVSGVALSRFGVDLTEQLGKTMYEIFGGDEVGVPPIEAHELATGGDEVDYEQTVADRHFEVRVRPLRDERGEIRGCVGVAMDVTERQQAENALRESEERYRILYHDNPSMYFTVCADGQVLSVNAFGAQQLGYLPEELVGRSVLDVFHADDRQEVSEQLAACILNLGEVRNWEFRKVRKDGRVIWVKEAARATRDATGGTLVLVVCEDITERKQMEEDLERAREELEQKVAVRVRGEPAYGLTFRELTVLHLVAAGSSDRDIAVTLGISPLTVSKHVANILLKMGAASRSEASARAVRESLLE